MFLIIAISAILAVSVADPLGCCLPSRWTGLIVANEGQLSPNDTKAQAIDVSTYIFTKTSPCNIQIIIMSKNNIFSRKRLIFFIFLIEAVLTSTSVFWSNKKKKKNRFTPLSPSFTF